MRKQRKLADTLAHLADAGLDDFYRGDIAREIAADLEALGSPVTRADLKAYEARWREPLSVKTRQGDALQHAGPDPGARLADDPRHLRAPRRHATSTASTTPMR